MSKGPFAPRRMTGVEALFSVLPGLDDPQLLGDSLEDFKRARQLLLRVSGGDDGADARLALRHGGIADARGEHSVLEKLARKIVGQRGVAHDDGRDGRLAHAGVEPEFLQAILEKLRVRPEVRDQLRFFFQDFERGDARGGDGWRVGSGEEKRPGAVTKKLDGVARGADVPAERADGFRQRSHLDVHAPVQVEMVYGAAPVAP